MYQFSCVFRHGLKVCLKSLSDAIKSNALFFLYEPQNGNAVMIRHSFKVPFKLLFVL